MQIKSKELIEELINNTKDILNQVQACKEIGEKRLNWKASPEQWSVLECIEHLNRYGDFYIPEIRQRMEHGKKASGEIFKSGLLGNYFAKSMLPKEKLNKMKTFKSMNPVGSDLEKSVVDTFIDQQKQILNLLDLARVIDLNKTKTSISISKWITLRLGDTFRVVIYHNQRHMVQMKNILLENEKLLSS